MSDAVARALDAFVARVLDTTRRRHGRLPCQPFDPEWPSPCQTAPPLADGTCAWQPVRRALAGDFSGLAAALEVTPHPDWQAFFSRYWSDHLPAGGLYGRLDLLQLWNESDEERLVANQIGHALQRVRRRQPLTLFFACGDDPDLLYAVDNATGKVLRESLAQGRERTIAASLAEFLDGLEPLPLD